MDAAEGEVASAGADLAALDVASDVVGLAVGEAVAVGRYTRWIGYGPFGGTGWSRSRCLPGRYFRSSH